MVPVPAVRSHGADVHQLPKVLRRRSFRVKVPLKFTVSVAV